MVKGVVGNVIKCLLFTATALIFLGGIAVFSVGVWAALEKIGSIQQILGTELYTYAAYVFIVTGAGIAVISFLGCCGALQEDRFKLALYFIILLVVFVILLAGGIIAYVFKDKLERDLLSKMNSSIDDYGQEKLSTAAWDATHILFKCCGVSMDKTDSYLIWQKNEFLKNESLAVPESCCKDKEDLGTCQKDPANNVFEGDCYVEARKKFMKNSKIIGAIGIAIPCLLFVGMLLTCGLYKKIRY